MSEYTPTTKQIRERCITDPEDEYHNPINAPANRLAAGREFDRWLAAHDAEVRRDAAAQALEHPETIDEGEGS